MSVLLTTQLWHKNTVLVLFISVRTAEPLRTPFETMPESSVQREFTEELAKTNK